MIAHEFIEPPSPCPLSQIPANAKGVLSEYLGVLRRFLILQLTTQENRHVQIIWHAVRSLATELSTEALLEFVNGLWRGRWIIGAPEWSHMRRSVLTGGTDEGIAELQSHASCSTERS